MQLTPISSCLVCLCFNQRPKILRLLSRLHRFVLGLSLLLSLLLSYYEPLAQVPPLVLKLISDPGSHLRKLFSSRHQFNFPQLMKSRRVSTLLRRPWLPPRLPPPITKIHTNGCERCWAANCSVQSAAPTPNSASWIKRWISWCFHSALSGSSRVTLGTGHNQRSPYCK